MLIPTLSVRPAPITIRFTPVLPLLFLGTVATILFVCCWHCKRQKRRHPVTPDFSEHSRSRDAVVRTHPVRAQDFVSSPCHARRHVAPCLEERQPIVEAHHLSEQKTSVRKGQIKKTRGAQTEFDHSVQVTPTRKPSSGYASDCCSTSSSAYSSAEEDFSQRPATVSPALPGNLLEHEGSEPKIQRPALRMTDEWYKVQMETFTKRMNQHLMKVEKHVNDLYEDLKDGHNLISLLEVLYGDTLPRERDFLKTLGLVSSTEACANEQHEDVEDEDTGPREEGQMLFHKFQNVQTALDYLKKRQISDIHVTGESEDMTAKERLLLWSQQTTEGCAGTRCENSTTCWCDGRLFNVIIHKYRPDLIDMNTIAVQSNLANLEHAFLAAEKLDVARLLDPEDVDVSSPDEKSVKTYVSSLYHAFPKVPEGGEGIGANDVGVKWVEYQNMVNYLMQWIRHHDTIMCDRTFPSNPVELKALYNQYLQFKETGIPPKEMDKSKIECLYKLPEVWTEFGRIKLPQGCHPNDIEKEWGKLIAMLEREKTLRPEVERETESGLQFQHEAEIAGYLLESENLLRQQVIDAQILTDGEYSQADQLVQSVAKLHDELVAIRTECSSVYNKGHALTTEQTKLMISGITESLNSGFTTNLSPELNAAMAQGLTPTLTSSSLTSGRSSGLTSRLTPAITPAYTPGIPPWLIQSYATGDSGTLQSLKLLMQIGRPLMKSAIVDQNLTEEEVNMKFVQDLLSWVEEMQVQLDQAEWSLDLRSIESHLENHKNVHKAIGEFESSLKEAKISEIKTMLPGEHQQVLSNLQSRFDDFVEDSQESKIFTSSDTAQLAKEVNVCKQYYQELLKSAEREEQEESIYNLYISEVRNIRIQLESCEERLIWQIRTPMERDGIDESVFRIAEQEKLKKELDRLKDDLGVITDKCEEFFSQAAGSPSVPILRSELNVVIQNLDQVYSMSSVYIDKNRQLEVQQFHEALEQLVEKLSATEKRLTNAEPIGTQASEVQRQISQHKDCQEEILLRKQNVDVAIQNGLELLKQTTGDEAVIIQDKLEDIKARYEDIMKLSSNVFKTLEQALQLAGQLQSTRELCKWLDEVEVELISYETQIPKHGELSRVQEGQKPREFANFDFDIWRKKYMRWMNYKRSRVMGFFRRIDKDQDGKITREEFINGILSSKFPTSQLQMSAVADIFDRDGYIDYYEFVAALCPNKDAYIPLTDADKIEDEVIRQVAKCRCAERFQLEQIGNNKYRFDSSQLHCFVCIITSTGMVRVGGGWMTLTEFFVRHDPCRETRRTQSRPGRRAGSKAVSRSSSCWGDDASHFDILR